MNEETKEEVFERDTKLNIHQRISAIMGEIDYIKKEKSINASQAKGGHKLYNVTGHDAVTKLVHPLLVKYGVNVYPSGEEMIQEGNRTRLDMIFTWQNIDDPVDFMDKKWKAYGIDYEDKGPGKAASYAQRMHVLKILHIETGEKDIEEDAIEFDDSTKTPNPEQSKPTPAPATTESKSPSADSSGGEKKVSKAQAGLIFHKFEDAGFNKLQMKEYMRIHYGVESKYSRPMYAVKEIVDLSDKGELMTLEQKESLQDDIPF